MKTKNETQATINTQATDTMTQPQDNTQQETAQAIPQQFTPTATQDEAEIAALEAQPEEAAITAPADLQATTQQATPVVPADAWSYFCGGHFDNSINNFRAYANRQTGFPHLDAKQAFCSGLYFLGAVSGVGKTTLAYQLADNLATRGEDVLYFSLEQTRFELFSKSISREFFIEAEQTPCYPRYTSIEIRSGVATDNNPLELQDRINAHLQNVGDRMRIIAPESPPNVEEIRAIIEGFIQQTGRKPFVVIDYIQIIKASVMGNRPLEGRASIDHIITSLKAMQKHLDLTLLVISSLNRANYINQIDFESFKESGLIEYSGDVVWGLQYYAVRHHPVFTDAKIPNLNEKRDVIRREKRRYPRLVELVCLKNRYGQAGYSVEFEYYSPFDTFVDCVPHEE